MTDEDSILNVDQEIEPIVSMRDSILTYLTVLMENEVDPKTTSDEQYNCMLQCLKISCDIAVQCKESYRTYNTALRHLGWDPSSNFKITLSECFKKIYKHRTSEEFLSHDKADDGLEQHHREEIHQYNIVEQVVSPYMKYVFRERPKDCDTFGCATIILTTRDQTHGYINELVKYMVSEVKKMPNGFKTYFTIQKQILIPIFDDAMKEKSAKKRKGLLSDLNAFAKKMSDKLRFSLNGHEERNVLIQFLADGLMFALGNRNDSYYLTALQPYLSLLQSSDAILLVKLINDKCQEKDLRDPWINDKEYAGKHAYYTKFCESLKKKTDIEITIQQEYKREAVTPGSPSSIRDADIDESSNGKDKTRFSIDDSSTIKPPDVQNQDNATGPTTNIENKKKRKYTRGNSVTGLSEDEELSDLSSSGISSSSENDDEDLIHNSEDDFEDAPAPRGKQRQVSNQDSDGNISDNSSNNGSSAGNLSDTSQSNVDNRNRVIRGLRRRSRPKSRTSTVRHQPSEASIDEIEEESDVSIDDSDNDFEISPGSMKRQRLA